MSSYLRRSSSSLIVMTVLILMAFTSTILAQQDEAHERTELVGAMPISFSLDKGIVLRKLQSDDIDPLATLDGRLNEPWWQEATPLSGFLTAYFERSLPYPIEYKMAYDDHYLYVGGMIDRQEADTLSVVEVVLRPESEGALHYAASIRVNPVQNGRTVIPTTYWNPSPLDLSDNSARINVSNVIYETSDDGDIFSFEAAIPIHSINSVGVRPGDEWQINIVHVHQLFTNPLTSWIPIRNSDQWSSSPNANTIYANLIGQGRTGSIFFDRLPERFFVTSDRLMEDEVLDGELLKDAQLIYKSFTTKQLHVPLSQGLDSFTDLQLHWQSPGERWQELTTFDMSRGSDVVTIEFEHPGPLSDGVYKLVLTYASREKGARVASLLTIERERMIESGLAALDAARSKHADIQRPIRTVEWSEPSDEVLRLIDLIPPQPGFRLVGIPEIPDEFPDGFNIYRSSGDGKQIISLITGTEYPNDQFVEDQRFSITNRRGEPTDIPYYQDERGRRYFLTGHLWYVQKSMVISQLSNMVSRDPLGAARIIYAFAEQYSGYQPMLDRQWFNHIVQMDQGPPYSYWGGVWNRWFWNDLSSLSPMVEAFGRLRDTNALDLLSQEVGEDVERKMVEEMFAPSVEYVLTYNRRHGNMAHSLWIGLIRIGIALNEPDYIHRAVELIRDFAENGKFLADGFWAEVTLSYHNQTINGLDRAVQMLKGWTDPEGYMSPRTGVRFDNLDLAKEIPSIRRSLEITNTVVYPNRNYLPIQDTWANIQTSRRNDRIGTLLLPASRIARLSAGRGHDETQVYMSFQPKYSHLHRDGINLVLFAGGHELLPDLGYSLNSRFRWFTVSTMGHNTVVVNGQDMSVNDHSKHGGNIETFVSDDLFQLMRVSYEHAYPSTREYGREVWFVPFEDGDEHEGYIIDIFRVFGGMRHEYTLQGDANRDSVFQTDHTLVTYGPHLLPPGTPVTESTGPSTSGSAGGHYPGYIYIQDVYQAQSEDDQFSLILAAEEQGVKKPQMKITGLFDTGDNELFLGRSPSIRPIRLNGFSMDVDHFLEGHTMPKMVWRREGPGLRSDFVTLMEPFYGRSTPRVDAIDRMPIKSGPQGAVALRVIYGNTTDIFLSNPHYDEETPLIVGDITLHGEAGLIRLKDGIPDDFVVIGGTNLSYGDLHVSSPGMFRGNVVDTMRQTDGDPYDAVVITGCIPNDVIGTHIILEHPDRSTSGFEIGDVICQGDRSIIVLAEHDPAFEIMDENNSRQTFYPRKQWQGEHTFKIIFTHHERVDEKSKEKVSQREHTGAIYGMVYDPDGNPVINATVHVAGYPLISAATSNSGEFLLDLMPEGKQWIKIVHPRFVSVVSDAILVDPHSENELNIAFVERHPAELYDVSSEVKSGDPISATTSMDAMIYLLRSGTLRLLTVEEIRRLSVGEVEAVGGQPAFIPTEEDFHGNFMLYAVDDEGRISSPVSVFIEDDRFREHIMDIFSNWGPG